MRYWLPLALLCLALPLAFGSIPKSGEGLGEPAEPQYLAQVFDQADASGKPVFDYSLSMEGEKSRVVYYEPGGAEVVVEEYAVDEAGRLKHLRFAQKQLAESGSIEVGEGKITFRYKKPDEDEIVETEKLSELPTVAPGTLARFIAHEWDRLMAGATVEARLALVERQETVGIEIERSASDERDDARRVLKIKPGSFVLSVLFPAILVTLDASSRRLVSFLGPVPTQLKRDGKWEAFKAEVRVIK